MSTLNLKNTDKKTRNYIEGFQNAKNILIIVKLTHKLSLKDSTMTLRKSTIRLCAVVMSSKWKGFHLTTNECTAFSISRSMVRNFVV